MNGRWLIAAIVALLTVSAGESVASEGYSGHAIAMHGAAKYGADFKHFDYVNPDAPKGGMVRLAATGSFDSFNPYIIKGLPAAGVGFLFETLMESSDDEAFTEYGLIAGKIEFPADRSWVTFTLRDEARWHDGTAITVADVIFSFETLKTQGAPLYRYYYADVSTVEDLGGRQVRFTFKTTDNKELPLILGQLPVLSKRYFTDHPFDQTSLEPPVGSGPYRVESFEAARSVTYRRDPGYWGAHLAINRGRWNFDVIQYEYYRDSTVAIEAFKAHEFDFRAENSAKVWATAYEGERFTDGLIVREEIPHELPTGMQGFAYNLRRTMFQDARVREALAFTFDFEWANRTLFYGAYARTTSYFSNSELASRGLPSAAELRYLEPHRSALPPALFEKEYAAPATDGSGSIRNNLRAAGKLLDAAGWRIKDGARRDPNTGEPMAFEFLLVQPTFERIVQPMIANLNRLGIKATIRIVDTSQYQNRIDEFDFDIITNSFGQSLSPGNEQREFWGSEAADTPGGRNVMGVKNPVIDALIDDVIAAPDRETLIAATRALDRVLLSGHYMIPQFHIRSFRVVYWDKFSKPRVPPRYGLGFTDTWWVDESKRAVLEAREAQY